jgi:uncharacterized protein (TIGR00251 family)
MAATITPHAEGATLALRVRPKAKRNAALGEHGGALEAGATAPPEDGRANDAVLALLRETFGLPRARVVLLSGQTNRNEVVPVRGVTAAELLDLDNARPG